MSFLKRIDVYSFICGILSITCLLGLWVVTCSPVVVDTIFIGQIYLFMTNLEILLLYIDAGNAITPEMLPYFLESVADFREILVDKK
jgi:hypothetical protein